MSAFLSITRQFLGLLALVLLSTPLSAQLNMHEAGFSCEAERLQKLKARDTREAGYQWQYVFSSQPSWQEQVLSLHLGPSTDSMELLINGLGPLSLPPHREPLVVAIGPLLKKTENILNIRLLKPDFTASEQATEKFDMDAPLVQLCLRNPLHISRLNFSQHPDTGPGAFILRMQVEVLNAGLTLSWPFRIEALLLDSLEQKVDADTLYNSIPLAHLQKTKFNFDFHIRTDSSQNPTYIAELNLECPAAKGPELAKRERIRALYTPKVLPRGQ